MVKVVKPIEVGNKVSWVRRNGIPARGVVVKHTIESSGQWFHVETATKGQPPLISKVRPAVLKRV
jgi:hypothetical protein